MLFSRIPIFLITLLLCGVSLPALAYIGPGSGLSLLGGLWSLLLGIFLALGAILLWPIRLLLRRMGLIGRAGDRRSPGAGTESEPASEGDRDSGPDHAPPPRIPGWRAVALLAVVAATLAWLGGPAPVPEPAAGRVIVLGFDGMDPNLARRWMYELKLPNFARLARDGHFQALGTSNPPQSPVAWSDFAVGDHAGHHGIFDFLRRDPETYAPRFSISEDIPPESRLELFGMSIPLESGEVLNRRQGQPFWSAAEEAGTRASVLRVPVTYPPDDIHRMLSGMGVPDLLGTQGTYTLYSTTRLDPAGDSSRVVRVRPGIDGTIETILAGPLDPLKPDDGPLELPLTIAPDADGARVRVGDLDRVLAPGEWSDWVTLSFDGTGPVEIAGTARLLLVQGYPRPRLYVSPLQIDPRSPVAPISSPPEYAAELARRIGLFHTLGMPEETWSLNEEHISDGDWLEMQKGILAEREAMWYDTLARNDSELVVGVFVQTDRVSHMFWRGLDPEHPRHADTAPEHRNAVEWIYREADRILGETLDRMGPNDELIVLSDHGFAPFRHAVHLNRWLAEQGYLVLADGTAAAEAPFRGVDWRRSRAYAMGLNGVFLNLAGRERDGIVAPENAAELKREIADALLQWRDPDRGDAVIRSVFDADDVYADSRRPDERPDLVIGYAGGYRASWQTTLGAVPSLLIEPNRQKWSGDHCIDPELVPGVLFSSFRPEFAVGSLRDVRGLVESRLNDMDMDPGPDSPTPAVRAQRGLLDHPGGVLARIDRALRSVLPPALALVAWALVSAWLTMWVYGRTSRQDRLASIKRKAQSLRRSIRDYQGPFSGLMPLVADNLRLSLKQLALAIGPAVLAGLPVLIVLVWIAGAYGPRLPMAGTETRVEITAGSGIDTSEWHWHGTPAERAPTEEASVGWDLAWPMPAMPARLRADTGPDHRAAALVTLPIDRPSTVLHKRQWWNTLIANPAGYLPDDSPIDRLQIELPQFEVVPLGPDWMRGWMFWYFLVLVAAAIALKIRWRIH